MFKREWQRFIHRYILIDIQFHKSTRNNPLPTAEWMPPNLYVTVYIVTSDFIHVKYIYRACSHTSACVSILHPLNK